MIILDKLKNLLNIKKGKELLINNSFPISIQNNKITIKGDLDIYVDGNLRILSEGHTVFQTSRKPSNDEFEKFSLHLNPSKENSVYIKDKNE